MSFNYNKYETFYLGKKEIDNYIINKSYLDTKDQSVKLFYTNVIKKDLEVKANIIIVHGFSEHMNKYFDIAVKYADIGLKVHIYDQRGFGRSGGTRAYSSFEEIYYDFNKLLNIIDKDLPLFILAHSLGGGIITSILNINPHLNIAGVFLCNPWYNFAPQLNINLIKKLVFNFISCHVKEILILAPLSLSGISKDPVELEKIVQDKWSLPFLTSRFLKTFCDVSYFCRYNINKVFIPMHYFVGKKDPIVPISNTFEVYNKLTSTNKSIKVFENGLHELIFDFEKNELFDISKSIILEKLKEKNINFGNNRLIKVKSFESIYDKVFKYCKRFILFLVFILVAQKKFKLFTFIMKLLKLKR